MNKVKIERDEVDVEELDDHACIGERCVDSQANVTLVEVTSLAIVFSRTQTDELIR
jgi:hypothetical protein